MRRVRRSRRRVVASVVAAVLVVGVGASTASATVAGEVVDEFTSTGQYADFYRQWFSEMAEEDYESKNLKVAAPSSVIAATGSEAPERRVQEVTRWRSNTQAWIDAKARNAGSSGLTSEALDSVARWKPVVSKAIGLAGGATAVFAGDTAVTWVLRDGVLFPLLEEYTIVEDARGQVANRYCNRFGNAVTDWFGRWVGADCAAYRLAEDYGSLLGGAYRNEGNFVTATRSGVVGPIRNNSDLPGASSYYQNTVVACVRMSDGGYPSGVQLGAVVNGVHWWTTGNGGWSGSEGLACTISGGHMVYSEAFSGWPNYASPAGWRVVENGQVVAQAEVAPHMAEWVTKVRCLDGSYRYGISDAFQQEALGQVFSPASVSLGDCKPVEVSTGMQQAGRGVSGAGGGWSSVPTNDGSPVSVGSSEVPTEVQDWMRDFPSCWDGSCTLELKKVIGGTMELDCFQSPDQCANWWEEVQASPDTYKCYYGGVLVAIGECAVYAPTFVRDRVQQGTGYADPKTGETVTTSTGTNVTTNPGAAATAMSSPAADPAANRQCWPTGWGVFNPFEWVYLPVKCALEWAFVPKTSKLTQVQTALQLKATNSGIAQVARVADTWSAVVDGINPSGCAGPTISLNLMGIEYSGNPLSACAEPTSTLAFWSRIIIGIAVTLAAVFAVTRYVGRVIGYDGFGRSSGGDT